MSGNYLSNHLKKYTYKVNTIIRFLKVFLVFFKANGIYPYFVQYTSTAVPILPIVLLNFR